ncbi:BTB/POZ domain-containing protein 6-A isoform X1 [Anopheles cruzii]|uniref:BTB/POZ domain-containing protein 6-A isoform X1 n=2 Tax=Anopheles cruzii TaxID=68878 RepID=UPI0022EC5DEA|nr:BTB/POZ domain-containing protein 6-A isoform X1 [Anopheles cruzii]
MESKIPSHDMMLPEGHSADFGQRFNELRKNNHLVDCSFRVDDAIFHCHKLILSAASPVFETMFYGALAEKQTVHIADIKQNVFECMLEYIYAGSIDFDGMTNIEELLELYYCAEKYMIDSLHKKCVNYFGKNIKPNNVLKILDIAYRMNLDDIIYSCMCVLRHFLSSGMSLSNIILESNHHLSKDCVDLILEDNYEVKDNIICLVRAWCITECEQNRLEISPDSMKTVLQDIELPDTLKDTIVGCSFTNFTPIAGDKSGWIPVQRIHYKAVRPLIIGDEMEFEASVSSNRFIVLKSLSINSRLLPQLTLSDVRQETYTEKLSVEISTKCSKTRQTIYQKEHVICDVAFNGSLQVSLTAQIVLFPDVVYLVRLRWDAASLGYEYPRSILSAYGKCKQLLVNFNENVCFQSSGSILNGIVCDLYK